MQPETNNKQCEAMVQQLEGLPSVQNHCALSAATIAVMTCNNRAHISNKWGGGNYLLWQHAAGWHRNPHGCTGLHQCFLPLFGEVIPLDV